MNNLSKLNQNSGEQLLRLSGVLALVPVSKSTWLAGVRSGKYPPAVKLSKGVTCWRRSAIDQLIQSL